MEIENRRWPYSFSQLDPMLFRVFGPKLTKKSPPGPPPVNSNFGGLPPPPTVTLFHSCPHFIHRVSFFHCKAFDLQVRIPRSCLWKNCSPTQSERKLAHPNLPSTHLLSNVFPENFHFPKMSSNVKDYPPPAPLAEQLLTQ